MADTGTGKGVSLLPDDMVAGGLIGDPPLNLLYRKMRFEVWDYDGKAPEGSKNVTTLAVRGELVDDDGKVHNQYWSAGDPGDFQPSPDGKRAVAVGRREALNNNTNVAVLMAACINAGFPKERIGDDISVLDGMYALSHRVPAPERTGLKRAPDARPLTVLVPAKILRLPGEGQAQTTGLSASTSTPAVTAEDLMADALSYAAEMLAEKGAVKRGQLTGGVFTRLGKHPRKAEIAKLVHTQEFIDRLVEVGIGTVEGDSIKAA